MNRIYSNIYTNTHMYIFMYITYMGVFLYMVYSLLKCIELILFYEQTCVLIWKINMHQLSVQYTCVLFQDLGFLSDKILVFYIEWYILMYIPSIYPMDIIRIDRIYKWNEIDQFG